MTTPPVSPCDSEHRVAIERLENVPVAQAVALRVAASAGMTRRCAWELTIAVSEAATNMVQHAAGGLLVLRRTSAGAVEFEALDQGPGIAEPEAVLRDGFSENRELAADLWVIGRRGLGLGLGAIKRLTDSLEIVPRSGGGTVVRGLKLARGTASGCGSTAATEPGSITP